MTKLLCPHCGNALALIDPATLPQKPVKPVREVVTKTVIKREKMSRRAHLFLSRGCDVPPEKEADWKTLKSSGMTNEEAAQILSLSFMSPAERTN